MLLVTAVVVALLGFGHLAEAATRPSGICVDRPATYDECHGKEFDGQKCDTGEDELCVLCDAGTDQAACKPLSDKGSCDGWTFVCSVKNSDDGRKDIKSMCRDDCEDSKSGAFTETNGFEGKGYCRCNEAGKLFVPSYAVILAAGTAIVAALHLA